MAQLETENPDLEVVKSEQISPEKTDYSSNPFGPAVPYSPVKSSKAASISPAKRKSRMRADRENQNPLESTSPEEKAYIVKN